MTERRIHTMNVEIMSPVGQIAAAHPLTTRVFARHQIDYCCGGGLPLEKACANGGLDANMVLKEIKDEIERNAERKTQSWAAFSPEQLIDHILETFHEPLYEELPRLAGMTQKVLEVHRDKNPEQLEALSSVMLRLKSELESHMAKEENFLFPMIRQGNWTKALELISVMEQEHEQAGQALGEIRKLTQDFKVPEEACTTWKALWHGLERLEEDLHSHIHLENNVLFSRVLETHRQGVQS